MKVNILKTGTQLIPTKTLLIKLISGLMKNILVSLYLEQEVRILDLPLGLLNIFSLRTVLIRIFSVRIMKLLT